MSIRPLGTHWQQLCLIFIWLRVRGTRSNPRVLLDFQTAVVGSFSPTNSESGEKLLLSSCVDICFVTRYWDSASPIKFYQMSQAGPSAYLRDQSGWGACLFCGSPCLAPPWNPPTRGGGQPSSMPVCINRHLQLSSD